MKHWVLLFFMSALHVSYWVLADTDQPSVIPPATTPQQTLPQETPRLQQPPLPVEKSEQPVQGWWGAVHTAWQQVWIATRQAAETLQEPFIQLCDNTVKTTREWTSDLAAIAQEIWTDSKQWLAERGGDMDALWRETQQWMQSIQQNWLSFSQFLFAKDQAPHDTHGDASEAPSGWTQTISQWIGTLQTLWHTASSNLIPPAKSPADQKTVPSVPAPATPAPTAPPPAPLLTTPALPAATPSSAEAPLPSNPPLSVPTVTLPPTTDEASGPVTH